MIDGFSGAAQEELLKEWDAVPPVLVTSSRKGDGRQDLLAYIAQLRDLFTGAIKPVKRTCIQESEIVIEPEQYEVTTESEQ